MKFVFNRDPHAQRRHRQGKGFAYDPDKSLKHEIKFEAGSQMREKGFNKLSTGPLGFKMINHLAMPQTWSTSKRNAFVGKPCDKKMDWDNLAKFMCDALNGLAYHDDRQITDGRALKLWAEEGKMEVEIWEII